MKCFLLLLFPFLLVASSKEYSHAFGFGAGLSMMKYDLAVPVPTVSFYWLNTNTSTIPQPEGFRVPEPSNVFSSVTAFDIVSGFWIFRIDKKFSGSCMFDQFAQKHEHTLITGTSGLGHIMRYNYYCVVPA